MSSNKRYWSLAPLTPLLLVPAVAVGVDTLSPKTMHSHADGRQATATQVDQRTAAAPNGGGQAAGRIAQPKTSSPPEETIHANVALESGDVSATDVGVNDTVVSVFASPKEELSFLQQRRGGESRQVVSREQSLLVIEEALRAGASSAVERHALEAREVQLHQRIEQHRRRLQATERRIAALEAARDATNEFRIEPATNAAGKKDLP